jgi:hypothetical protein
MMQVALCAVLLVSCVSPKTPSEGDPMSARKSEVPATNDAAQGRLAAGRSEPGERIVPLAPVRGPMRLAFAGDRLAQIVDDGVLLWHGDTLAASVKVPLSEPQGMAALADGSITVVHTPSDGRKLCRIAPMQSTLGDCHPTEIGEPRRLTFVGAAAKDELWLRAPTSGQQLTRWRMPAGGGALERIHAVPVIDKAYDTLLAIGDGSCVYTDGYNLYRAGSAPAPERFEGTTQAIQLIARGPQPGTVWIAGKEFGLRSVRLTNPLTVVVDLPAAEQTQPIAIAGSGSRVAVLWASVQDLRNPTYTLRVYDSDGKIVLETVPSWQPKTREEAQHVSLALRGERLAMGNSERLTVWVVPSGRVLVDTSTRPKH